jgi:hypothetical protein
MRASAAAARRPALLICLAVLATCGGLAAALCARAAEVSREEFVTLAEPICERDTKADERILANVRAEVRAGHLKPAAASFASAARALAKARSQLEAVPRPPADEARLGRWFADIGAEIELFEAVAAQLRKGDRAAAERTSVKLTSAANRANAEALPFEFHWCRADPARFT